MKRITTGLLTICMLIVAVMCASAEPTIEQPADCLNCGMNRTAFAHSRVLVKYEDGKTTGTCSINCAVIDLKKIRPKE